ncbi:MAG: right-handed parallel beta-helix repeat-containing protein [Lachnospiraceae bacterium]|nr:right-handed parallel beta-helix repeat-containing protein [Lachnospiraceae bacterium]
MLYYVNQAAACEGDGSKNRPFKRISDAARVAMPGDEVIVAKGVYREYVNPFRGGTKDARIVYRSEEPLGAVVTGAEKLSGWTRYQDYENVWTVRVDNGIFGDYNPYTTEVYGDWYFAPAVRHTGAVYLNDVMLYETESLEECIEGKVYTPSWDPDKSIYKWYTEQDNGETVLYANFQGYDPNKENVEINVRRRCFFPSNTGRGYITVSGFVFTKAATTWAPPAAFQDGMVGPHWSKGWIIEDCEVSNSKCCGISLGKYYDAENDHYFTKKHMKSPTQMERDAVCRGQYHGWLKEKVGSHIVRRCHIHHCEQTGIVGRMGAVFSLIEDNHIHHINNMQQLGGAEISGIKLHAAIDVVIRRNHIHHSTMGIWCDWEAQGTRISQNLLHDNYRPDFCTWAEGGMGSQDIFVEVGHGPTLIDNNIMLSKASLMIATESVAMVHNLILGAFLNVGAGTGERYTPYHIRHRTEVAGFMTILHGDDRFYNNIFVQKWPIIVDKETGEKKEKDSLVGTWQFDEYPTYEEWIPHFDLDVARPDMGKLAQWHEREHLPVWAGGNAYLGGAKQWKKETNYFFDDAQEIQVELVEKDGQYMLETNVYDIIKDYTAGIITSDILGKAFQPEQRFENPDGSAITFDRDYFGDARGLRTVPGPFVSADSLKKKVW